MKQVYLNTQSSLTRAVLVVLVLLIGFTSYSQTTVPELVFKNSTKVGSAAAGANGATYWFKTVATDIDAMVKIVGRSHPSNVVLSDIDISNTGYDNAFQPLINFTNGGSINNNVITEWYIEFKISFVKSSDTSVSVPVTTFNGTALDVDGSDGQGNTYLHEMYAFYGLTSYILENNSTLTATNIMSGSTLVGKKFEAGDTEYDGIDVNASRARVTTKYDNTSSFTVRIGGRAKGPISIGSNGRQHAIWFKGFTYNIPVESPLPVKLLSFNAKQDKKGVVLDWATSMEKDFSHFIVERSTDGRSFSDAAIIFSDGNNSTLTKAYTFTDKADVQNTIVYYRLKMVDIDGKFEYSAIRIIRKAGDEQEQASVVVYPNPAVNEVRVTIPNSWQNKAVTYTLYNSNGTVVKQKVNNSAGQTEILNLSGMNPGLYMIKVSTGDQTLIKQFIKQ